MAGCAERGVSRCDKQRPAPVVGGGRKRGARQYRCRDRTTTELLKKVGPEELDLLKSSKRSGDG